MGLRYLIRGKYQELQLLATSLRVKNRFMQSGETNIYGLRRDNICISIKLWGIIVP